MIRHASACFLLIYVIKAAPEETFDDKARISVLPINICQE